MASTTPTGSDSELLERKKVLAEIGQVIDVMRRYPREAGLSATDVRVHLPFLTIKDIESVLLYLYEEAEAHMPTCCHRYSLNKSLPPPPLPPLEEPVEPAAAPRPPSAAPT